MEISESTESGGDQQLFQAGIAAQKRRRSRRNTPSRSVGNLIAGCYYSSKFLMDLMFSMHRLFFIVLPNTRQQNNK